MNEPLSIRIHGDASLPTLVYLPGLHGDWTLVSSFRAAVEGRVRFVEFTYPRTVTGSLDDYARAIEDALKANGIERGWLIGESFGSQPAWQLIARFHERQRHLVEPIQTREKNCGRTPLTPSLSPSDGERVAEGRVRGSPDTANPHPHGVSADFAPLGLILAGGFVRHPVIPAVRLMSRMVATMPGWADRGMLALYSLYAGFRHRHAPETRGFIREFVANRTSPGDKAAMVHRLNLIAANDPRRIARATTLPVRYLAGLVDPLVPWPFVRQWLRRHCPGYRGGRTILNADHNVLGTAPGASAREILGWMEQE